MQGVNRSRIRWTVPRMKDTESCRAWDYLSILVKNLSTREYLSILPGGQIDTSICPPGSTWVSILSTREYLSIHFVHQGVPEYPFCSPGSTWERSVWSLTWPVSSVTSSWQGDLALNQPSFSGWAISPKFWPSLSWIATEWEVSGLDSVRLEGYRVLLDYPNPVHSQIRYPDNFPDIFILSKYGEQTQIPHDLTSPV